MDAFELQLRDAMARRQAGQQAAQSFQMPQGRMVSGHYIPPSLGDAVVQGLRTYTGQKQFDEAGQEIEQLSQKRQQALSQALRQFGQQAMGTPAETLPEGVEGPTRPGVAPNMRGAYSALLEAPDAAIRQAGIAGLAQIPQMEMRQAERQEDRAFRAEQAEAARQQRMQELQLRLADQRTASQDRQNFQRELVQLQASLRPEQMMTVMDETGSPVTLPRSQAVGMKPYSPSAATAVKKQAESSQAKKQMNDALVQLKGYYDELKDQGGIVSEQSGALGNIAARASSSRLGQALGGAIGSKEQQLREKIEQTRPLLLNLIKNATGMSAQQMNSNAEMQLYLRAATDPTLSYEANIEALGNLDKLFGLGLGIDGGKPLSQQDQQALDWANSNPNDPRSAAIKQRIGAK